MIQVVEVNDRNQVVAKYSADVKFSDDVITLYPGVPPLNSPEFDAWLAEWHRVNNDRSIILTEQPA